MLAGVGVAQESAAPGATSEHCNVVTGSLDVNEEGELVRPPVTPEDCAAADALVEEFLGMSRGDFRRVDVIDDVPGNVSVYVGRMTPWGGSIEQLPVNRDRGVIWTSDRIVVVVVKSSDIAGPVTSVVIANVETRQLCQFERWPAEVDPRNLSVTEIQEILDRGLLGEQPRPACRLAELPID